MLMLLHNFIILLYFFLFFSSSSSLFQKVNAFTLPNNEITFHKIRVNGNPENRVSVRMYAYSPELILMHSEIRFYTNISTYHNSLLIDEKHINKFRKVTRESPVEYGNSMTMIMKSQKKIFAYNMVQNIRSNIYTSTDNNKPYYYDLTSGALGGLFGGSAMSLGMSSVSYDGVLLLDKYSSIWDTYNTVIFGRNHMTLKYHDIGSGGDDIDGDGDDDGIFDGVEDFSRLIHINCKENVLMAPCDVILPTPSSPIINDITYPGVRVLIDFNSAFNYLPIELYAKWVETSRNLVVQLANSTTLPLNNKFQFMMHEESVVILGVDVIHHFPKIAYSQGLDNRIRIWYYYSIEESFDTHQTVSIIFTFINAVIFICLFIGGTTYNYYILEYIVDFEIISKGGHFFAQKQVFIELLSIIIAITLWLVTLIFSWNSNYFNLLTYSSAYGDRRKVIFFLYSFYQTVVCLIIVCTERLVFKKALEIYTPRLYGLLFNLPSQEISASEARERLNEIARKKEYNREVDKPGTLEELDIQIYGSTVFLSVPSFNRKRLYNRVIKHYHDPVMKTPTDMVIMRNLKLILLILSNLMLTFNYQSDYNNIYLVLVVLMTTASMYYTLKYLCIVTIFMTKFLDNDAAIKQNKTLFVYTLCEIVVFIGFTVLSFNPVYLVYFNAINTGYSKTTITVFTLLFLTVVAIYAIYRTLNYWAEHNERILEHKKMIHKLTSP